MLANKKVLVLNKSWSVLGVISLERALKKVSSKYRDGTPKAKIIDCVHDFQTMTWEDWSLLKPKNGEESMKSVNAVFRIPEVIQFTRYDKLPQRRIHYNRRNIYRRDNHTCQYCGEQKPGNELSLDHVVPRCQGGLSTWENTVVACTDCNFRKAGRTPRQAGMKLLSVPEKPKNNFFYEDIVVKSWHQFFNSAFWNVELENDNED